MEMYPAPESDETVMEEAGETAVAEEEATGSAPAPELLGEPHSLVTEKPKTPKKVVKRGRKSTKSAAALSVQPSALTGKKKDGKAGTYRV